jgi:PAS domain-containing protein
MVERSPVRRPLPPEPAPALPRPPAEGGFDRFRAETPNAPGRWKPEPTPLPGRKTSAPPPPPRTVYPQSNTPVPRGRAAFPDVPPPPRQQDPFEQTIAARSPVTSEKPRGNTAASIEQTAFAQRGFDETFEQTMIAPAPLPLRQVDDTIVAAQAGFDTTLGPGHAAFDSAVEHLSGFAQAGGDGPSAAPLETVSDATLIANAELTITDATAACAELLGVPDEQLVGDSLPDVFLRAVRRAYAQPGVTISLSLTRGAHGTITVTFFLQRTGGTE